ncbi:MAG: glycosyltransferase [Treponema sp.]|nr:glycosyltransferase [Treponema sp.]
MAKASDSTSPKISIIVPVYKVEHYLRRCLDSIASQTFTDWECILIDDGSPDKSGVICDEYAGRDGRFRVIHQENKGVSAARNAGLDAARGEWIGFADSDDWCEKEYIEKFFSQAQKEKVQLVFCDWFEENGAKTIIRKSPFVRSKTDLLWKVAIGEIPGYLWHKFFLLQTINHFHIRFSSELSMWEDVLFVFNFCVHAENCVSINTPLYHYNLANASSLCHSGMNYDDWFNQTNRCIAEIEKKLISTELSELLSPALDYRRANVKIHYMRKLPKEKISSVSFSDAELRILQKYNSLNPFVLRIKTWCPAHRCINLYDSLRFVWKSVKSLFKREGVKNA